MTGDSANRAAVQISAHAPGKLIVLGEYAVLEGAPALVMAVNRFARVQLKLAASNESSYSVQSPQMAIPHLSFGVNNSGEPVLRTSDENIKESLRFFSSAFKECHGLLSQSRHSIPPCHILLDSSDFYYGHPPVKLGFGSSASLTVALAAAFYAAGTEGGSAVVDKDQLFRAALSAHHRAQDRTGSGIDIAAATYGGLLEFTIDKPSDVLHIPGHLHFTSVWTGKPASTTQFVAETLNAGNKRPGPYKTLIHEMEEISANGIRFLRVDDVQGFMNMVNRYHQAMERLGQLSGLPVVSEEHRRLAFLARENGAAYKPSGAGGGDCGMAFSTSEKVIQDTRLAMTQAGFYCPAVSLAKSGLEIIKE